MARFLSAIAYSFKDLLENKYCKERHMQENEDKVRHSLPKSNSNVDSSILEDYIPKRRSDLNVRQLDRETVALDRRNGLIHQFNQTASYIWQQCDGKMSIEEIVVDFSETFDVDFAVATKDVTAIVKQLKSLELLDS
jgi:hypothetical protein